MNGASRPIHVYFDQYNRLLKGFVPIVLGVSLLLFYLGITGLAWSVPFPHLNFLNNYNGYFNWASFIIAALMFYWYRQSAILSYFLLFLLFGISYGVTLITTALKPGEMSVLAIYATMLVAGLSFTITILVKRKVNVVKGLFLLPLWLVHFIAKCLSLNY